MKLLLMLPCNLRTLGSHITPCLNIASVTKGVNLWVSGIQGYPTAAKNPQANAICKRMHQTVGNSLHAVIVMQPPAGIDSANQLVNTALANCVFATCATLHIGLQASPGSLAFNRDVILVVPFVANCMLIQEE